MADESLGAEAAADIFAGLAETVDRCLHMHGAEARPQVFHALPLEGEQGEIAVIGDIDILRMAALDKRVHYLPMGGIEQRFAAGPIKLADASLPGGGDQLVASAVMAGVALGAIGLVPATGIALDGADGLDGTGLGLGGGGGMRAAGAAFEIADGVAVIEGEGA